MYLPVEQLHLLAKSLVDKFEQGGGTSYVDEAIVLGREALGLCPRPPRVEHGLTCA
jgi:hypothetical protein